MIESKPPSAADAPPGTSATVPMEERMWTYKEVASLMRVTLQTVQEWVKRGKIPSPIYIGFTARFSPDQVALIRAGVQPSGTFTPASSPREEIGRLGGSSPTPAKGKSKNPSQQAAAAAAKKRPSPATRQKPKLKTTTKPKHAKRGK